ncbi:hypothetical protein ACIRUL_04125, partial [Streptomyces sp. NPDC101171]|uniref:hypothetical protein n=1 Tax=Streptomyces sp. NPDC101171 TaxID=3366122 RepID=UPI00381C29C6
WARHDRAGRGRGRGAGHGAGRVEAGTMNGGHGRFTGRAGRTRPARGPWAVVCAVAAVVLGPAAATATASALDRADAAPPHHPAPAGTSDRPPADTTRRHTGA